MTWLQRYRLTRTLRWSLWILPVVAIGAAIGVAPFLRWVDFRTSWTLFNLTPDGARTILGALTASMLTFVVFVVSSLLIVVQLASAALTPRVIARVFADRRLKLVLSAFTFAYTYTIAAAGRIEERVPQLPVAFAIGCCLGCIAIFFWFVQWLGGSLRPIAMLQGVAEEGHAVVESVYPQPYEGTGEPAGRPGAQEGDGSVVEHTGRSGVVLAFSQDGLAALAERANAVIEVLPQVGDFVARGDPVFRVRHGVVDPGSLHASIAIGPERTMEQDPRFAFRILVDIAIKALSPAINDPTTAVLALDQIHNLLLDVGKRRLEPGRARDAQGHLRLYFETPSWNDYVSLAVTEIRQYGGSSVQVVRRLRAMIEHLLLVLPEGRKPALERELSLLQHAIERSFPDEQDQAQAHVGDFQGIGSSKRDVKT